MDDYDSQEMSLDVRHRPETETPIKNKFNGERFIALSAETCSMLDAWIADRRPDSADDYGRDPLVSTAKGRAHLTPIQSYVYSMTRPCEFTGECPHDREISDCQAAIDRSDRSRVRHQCHRMQFVGVQSRIGWIRTCQNRSAARERRLDSSLGRTLRPPHRTREGGSAEKVRRRRLTGRRFLIIQRPR